MTRRRIIIISLAVLVAAVAIICLCIPKEPRYQGRSLSEWIAEGRFDWTSSLKDLDTNPRSHAARQAIQALGTNAIPWILKWSTATDSKPKRAFFNLLAHTRFALLGFTLREEQIQNRGYEGAILLGEKARPAWPVFVQWTTRTNAIRRISGAYYLAVTGADKETFEPVLVRLIKDPDRHVSYPAKKLFITFYPKDAEAAGVDSKVPKLPMFAPTNEPAPNK